MRLIDAEDLDAVVQGFNRYNELPISRCEYKRIDAVLSAFPPIDAVPAVRCKDCRHSKEDTIFGGRWCQKPGSVKVVKDEFFCADGERKDDG